MAEDREQRAEEGQRVEHRDRYHDRAGSTHRRQEGPLEEQHGAQPDGDGDPGEGHGSARGPDGGDQGGLDRLAAGQLFAEAVDDEERVVDRDPKTDQGHDVGGIGRNVGNPSQQADCGQPADDRQPAHAQGKKHADHGGEDQEQQGHDDQQGYELRPLQVGGQVFVEVVPDGDVAGTVNSKVNRGDLGAQLGIVLARRGVVVPQRHDGHQVVPVGRGQRLGQVRLTVERRLDALDARVATEWLQRVQHRLFERRIRDRHRVAAEDQAERGTGPALGQLLLHQGQRPARLGVAAAAVLQRPTVPERDDRPSEQPRGDRQYGPAEPIDEATPKDKHLSPPRRNALASPSRTRWPSHSARRSRRPRRNRDPSPAADRCRAGFPR